MASNRKSFVTKSFIEKEIKDAFSILKDSKIVFDSPKEAIDKFCTDKFTTINTDFQFPNNIDEAKSAILSTAKTIGFCGLSNVSNKSKPAMCYSLKKIDAVWDAFYNEFFSNRASKVDVVKKTFPEMDSALIDDIFAENGVALNGVMGNNIFAAEEKSINAFVNKISENINVLVAECKGVADFDLSHTEL